MLKRILSEVAVISVLIGITCSISFSAVAVSKPGKVTRVTITKTCSTAVAINWTKSKGATKYIVYKKVNGGNYKKVTTTTNLNCLSNNLTKNKKYTFKISPYKVLNGKKYFGKSTTKVINLKTAKTKTPKLTSSNVKSKTKGIVKCVARCLAIGAYVNYDYSQQCTIDYRNYNLVTNCDSIKNCRKRMKKHLSNDIYGVIVYEDFLREYNNNLYVYIRATDDLTSFDLNSIKLKSQKNGYYNVYCDAYYGYGGGETLYKYHFKIKYSNGYFKCYNINLEESKYVGTVNKIRDLYW